METRPKVAVLAPDSTRRQCFEPSDWERLEERCQVAFRQRDDWDEEEIREVMAGADIVLTGWGTGELTESVLEPAPGLKLWVHSAGSMATMATEALFAREIVMSTANDVLARGVAEYALALTIIALKQVVPANTMLRGGQSWRNVRSHCGARELCNLRVGIVGFGAVGRHMARLLSTFRGLDLVVNDPHVGGDVLAGFGARPMSLNELCSSAHVIHNCVPWLPETVGLFSAEQFRSMRDDAVFINTGRGATVDEQALVNELEKGRLYACLDVTHPEPPPAGHPFYRLPNCLLTPHIAGAVTNGRKLLGQFAVDEIVRFLEGKPLVGQVSRQQVAMMTRPG